MPPLAETILSAVFAIASVIIIYKAGEMRLLDEIARRLEYWSHWQARQKMVWAARRHRQLHGTIEGWAWLSNRRLTRVGRQMAAAMQVPLQQFVACTNDFSLLPPTPPESDAPCRPAPGPRSRTRTASGS